MLSFNIHNISYLFLGWVTFIIISLIILLTHQKDKTNLSFYKLGPSDNLIILGIIINTPLKYIMIVIFSTINSAIRFYISAGNLIFAALASSGTLSVKGQVTLIKV